MHVYSSVWCCGSSCKYATEFAGEKKCINGYTTYLMKTQSTSYIYLWEQTQILHFTQFQVCQKCEHHLQKAIVFDRVTYSIQTMIDGI